MDHTGGRAETDGKIVCWIQFDLPRLILGDAIARLGQPSLYHLTPPQGHDPEYHIELVFGNQGVVLSVSDRPRLFDDEISVGQLSVAQEATYFAPGKLDALVEQWMPPSVEVGASDYLKRLPSWPGFDEPVYAIGESPLEDAGS